MTLPAPSGWGGGRWGSTGWGGAEVDDLRLNSAVAIRENAVRLTFNYAPVFDGLLSPNDASNAARYAVVGVAGTQGLDQLPVRPVGVLYAVVADVVESASTILDVFVDRPFSPYPAQYIVSVNNLVSAGSSLPLDPEFTSIQFFGVQALFVPSTTQSATPNRDFANPQVLSDYTEVDPIQPALGTFVVDETGDYAFDDGLANLRKRVIRRLTTRKGGFVHLQDYGVGVLDYVKKLGFASTRQSLAEEAQRQILLEPDVAACSVTTFQRAPGLVVFQVLVRTVQGSGGKVEVPVTIG